LKPDAQAKETATSPRSRVGLESSGLGLHYDTGNYLTLSGAYDEILVPDHAHAAILITPLVAWLVYKRDGQLAVQIQREYETNIVRTFEWLSLVVAIATTRSV